MSEKDWNRDRRLRELESNDASLAAKEAEIAALRRALLIGKRYVENEIEILNDEKDVTDAEADLAIINAALEMSGGVL
jgi:hypothetical protein